MIQFREWTFRVSCQVNPKESVFVTGSCDSLGSWDPQKVVPLSCEGSEEIINDETIWSATLHLPPEEIEYRFCVCTSVKKDSEVTNAVKRWETNLHPRIIPANENNAGNIELLSFGYINDFYKVDQGWLVSESAVFLKLCRSNVLNDPIVLWKKKYKNKKCYLKVTPIDITKSSYIDPLMDFPTDESTEAELMELRSKSKSHLPVVEVSVLRENATQFRYQEQFGVLCNNDEFIAFKCRLADPQTIGFLFDYYVAMEEEEAPVFVGCSFVLPSTFRDSYGVTTLPITSSKHIPIGQLTVSYMVVYPLREFKCNMRVSYARYWKESWRGLAVGHRGAGSSFHSQTKNCANIRENTIASLKYAYEHGADMVEFDVQLSKDLIPVIYHDFHTCIALKPKKETFKNDLMEIPIKDLTLSQLQALKIYHLTEKGMNKFIDDDAEDHQAFPTLEKVLESVPHSCGFNIEIKWTMRLKDGSYELEHPFELNRFLDTILKVVLQSSSPRKIIFSCFHPDICIMLRMKQNLYPVLFLTQGENKAWPSYDDVRTKNIHHAVLFASSADILGINVNTEDLLRDKNQIQLAFDHNQVVFSWGDENSDNETFDLLKDLGLHGIIFDKVDSRSSQKSSIFLCDDRETCRCFPSSCKSLTNGSNNRDYQSSSPTYSVGETSPASSGKRSPSNELPESSKRIRSDSDGSPLSFCGILGLN